MYLLWFYFLIIYFRFWRTHDVTAANAEVKRTTTRDWGKRNRTRNQTKKEQCCTNL